MVRGLLFVLVVAGCGGAKVRATSPGELALAAIRIEGNRSIETDDLIPGLALDRARRDGRPVDAYQLSLDTRRIRGEYMRMGFFDASVTTRVERRGNDETVIFKVVEGARAKARVFVTGLPPELPEERVLEKIELKEGAPFEYELYDDGKAIVKMMVEELGYPHVDVEQLSLVTVDRKAGVAVASYTVEAGPRATIGKITITGVPETGDLHDAILGRMEFFEGDVYSPRAISETTRALYELGRFSQVRIDFDHDLIDPIVPITIQVTPASRLEIRAGGGFGYEPLTYEARLRFGAVYIPVDYPLQTYSLDARVAGTVEHDFENFEPKVRVLGTLQRLEWLRPRLVGEVGAGVDFFTVEAYTAKGGQVRLGASTPLFARWLTLQAGWAISLLEFTGINEALDAKQRRDLNLAGAELHGRYEQVLVAELRDNQLEPRKGGYIAMRVTEGTIAAGGAFTYLQLQPDLRFYWPVGRAVLGLRLRGGTFFGDVPVTQRFFSGGAQNHRGFSARQLSPVELNEVPVDPANPLDTRIARVAVGGEAFMETGAELRIPLGELSGLMIGTTLFVDAGDVVLTPGDLDPTNLHVAAGIGMFVKYGGFKIRVDMGHRLTRRTQDGFLENTAPFVGVGETF